MVLLQATNLITKKELLTMDPDTDDNQLVYEITAEPKHGFLESKQKPGSAVTTFTQGTEPGAEPCVVLAPRRSRTAASSWRQGNIIFLVVSNAKKTRAVLVEDSQYFPAALTHLKVV